MSAKSYQVKEYGRKYSLGYGHDFFLLAKNCCHDKDCMGLVDKTILH